MIIEVFVRSFLRQDDKTDITSQISIILLLYGEVVFEMDDHCQQFFPPVFGIFTDNRTLQDQIETHETNFYQEADRKFFYQYQEEDFGPPSQMLRRVKIIFGGAGDSADHSAARFPDTESRGQGVGKSQFANFVRLASYRWA